VLFKDLRRNSNPDDTVICVDSVTVKIQQIVTPIIIKSRVLCIAVICAIKSTNKHHKKKLHWNSLGGL